MQNKTNGFGFDTAGISETTEWHQYFQNYEVYFEQAIKLPVSKGWHCKTAVIIYQQLLKYLKRDDIAIFIGLILAGPWVNAQTFELTKDSALIGEKVQ